MAPKLIEDAMEAVVLRLPAKSVGRFRCVSKTWRSRLSSSTFVKAHSNFHIHTSPVSIIFEYPLMDYEDYVNYMRDEMNDGEDDYLIPFMINDLKNDLNDWRNSMFDPPSPLSPSGSEDSYDDHNHSDRSRGQHLLTFAADGGIGKLVTSPLFEKGLVSVVAAYNGFVVVEIETDEDNSMFLFNPLTRETLKLPRFRPSNPYECRHFLGLGYDSLNGDYKIVRLSYSKRKQDGTFVDVYSFKMKSWRSLGKSPYCHKSPFPDPCPGVFVNGCLHWLVRDSEGSRPYVIVAFDLTKEEFREVPSPPKGSYDSCEVVQGSDDSCEIVQRSDDDSEDYSFDEIPEIFEGFDDSSQVVAFGGCLAVVCTPSEDYIYERIDVWVMREYGAQESWNKIMIDTGDIGIGKFVCLLREDEVVFRTFGLENMQFAAYSLSTGVWRYIVTDGDPYECLSVEKETGVVTFTDSLLSPTHILDSAKGEGCC